MGGALSNTTGTVLDPIFALRNRVRIPPGATVRLTFWTAAAASRAEVLDLYDKHHDANAYVRAATLAWTQAQVQLRHLGITAEEAILFQRLAGHILYADASMRPSSDTIRRGSGGRTALWAQGISGDAPILLLRIHDNDDIGIVRQLLRAHEYWRIKQLAVDLVILNERASSYVQDLQTALETAVRMSQSRPVTEAHRGADGAKGAVFVLRTDLVSAETRAVLSSVGTRRIRWPARQYGRATRSSCAAAERSRQRARRRGSNRACVRVQRRGPSWNSSTAWAASTPMGANTSRPSKRTRPRPRRGST